MTDSRHALALGQLLELAVLLNEDMAASLPRDGLTPSRAHLLWEVAQRGPSTQRVLAEALAVSPRNVTGLVDALVETGFVTREPQPGDRRAKVVTFTGKGRATVDKMATEHAEFARLLFGDMGAARLRGLTAGLDEVLSRLRPLVRPDSRKDDHA